MCNWRGTGPLIRLKMTLTVDRDVIILCDHLQPFMFTVHSDGFRQFQQDYATPQTCRMGTEWFQKYSCDFMHSYWSPKSPDMNEHYRTYLICLATCCLEEIFIISQSCGFLDCPAGFMV